MTERERSVAAAMHELAAARKRMPMVRVGHDYRFEVLTGAGRCPSCSTGGWWFGAFWSALAWLLCVLILTLPLGVMMTTACRR